MTLASFGRRVKEARKQVGMSQRELADKVGIDYGYLSKIERAKVHPPSEKVILAISRALALEKDDLLFLAQKSPSDLQGVINQGPYIPAILRRARGLTKQDWKDIDTLIASRKKGRHD